MGSGRFLLAMVLITVCFAACRSRERAVKVKNTPVELEASIFNMSEIHKNDSNLIYQIKCEESELTTGQIKGQGETVTAVFQVPGLKEKNSCDLTVSELKPSPDLTFIQGEGVLYHATGQVQSTVTGKFEVYFTVSLGFQYPDAGFELKVPVAFSENLPTDASSLQSSLVCEGQIVSLSEPLR